MIETCSTPQPFLEIVEKTRDREEPMWRTPPFPQARDVTGMLQARRSPTRRMGFVCGFRRSSGQDLGRGATAPVRTCLAPVRTCSTRPHLPAPARTRYSAVAGRNHRDGRNWPMNRFQRRFTIASSSPANCT